MNSFIETLNHWGENFLNFAWPMFWQSSLLIVILFALDFLFRRKIRASIRYSLWLVVLLKLILPPTLALPTSPVWWLYKTPATIQDHPRFQNYTVTYDSQSLPEIPKNLPAFTPPKQKLTIFAWLLVISVSVSGVLFVWLLIRWWKVSTEVRCAKISERLTALANEARQFAGIKSNPPVKLTANTMSPAVCGLFRPVILIPQSLVENFSDEQLRAVLLHELIHLRRRDVWVNFLQSLLQIFYWWQPLVWLANARIRRAREEAVDDAVMLALRGAAETYAPTLLEVAKLALNRPLASLGLVGILESRSALRQRIERLLNFRAPKKAGLTLVSIFGIAVFTAIAVPMGGAPSPTEKQTLPAQNTNVDAVTVSGILSNPNFRAVLSILEQRTGVETLAKPPEVVTTSGRGVNRIRTDNISTLLSNAVSESSNQMAMTFKLNQPIRQNELKEKLLAAGVKIPPTVFFYRDNGMMLARGSVDQLALVNRVVLNLNGYSTKEIDANYDEFVKGLGQIRFEDASTPIMTNLFSRHFKVGANTFAAALRNIPGLQTDDVSTMARSFFSTLNVDLDLPGKSVFYNDGLSELFVRGTEQDLDTIERAISVLNSSAAPQIHIKARFFEVPKGMLDGFTKMIGSTNQLIGILTSENAKVAMRTLEARTNVEILGEPEIVTISGRQTQFRATKEIKVISGISFEKNYHVPGISSNEVNSIGFQEQPLETGPVLDSTATVLPDGYMINLRTTASLTEFFGYAQNTNASAIVKSPNGDVPLPAVSPSVRIQKASARAKLYDGQTLLLGKFNTEAVGVKNFPKQEKKELLVLVTVTLVDPAGNRIHSDDEMSFARGKVPAQ
ncbi:MAG TPA: M56 family metallopeptidase [Verrucomicrobiae bacterium]